MPRRNSHFLELCLAGLALAATALPATSSGVDPARQIRFTTPAEADAKRRELIHFIWPDGLPGDLPLAAGGLPPPSELSLIDTRLARRVDRLEMRIANWDFAAIGYLLHPVSPRNAHRLTLVHQGHRNRLDRGLDRVINHLLHEGFTVAILHMPFFGWNRDVDGRLPGGRGFHIAARRVAAHNELFVELEESLEGSIFRFFLEPVVQTVNYFRRIKSSGTEGSTATGAHWLLPGRRIAQRAAERECETIMIGISGGGWTTSMAAAVDERICLSVPVAGSTPLWLRTEDPESFGDSEQHYAPLYSEAIAEDGSGGGVATWLEIYALGGYGANRRQIMVSNAFDPCCFSADLASAFAETVATRVSSLGAGSWQHASDDSYRQHKISAFALANIVSPALGIGTSIPQGLPIDEDFSGTPTGSIPPGWMLDPRNQGTASPSPEGITLSGRRLSAMTRERAFNPNQPRPVVVAVDFVEITADSKAGVLVTDDPYARVHHFGVFIDMQNRELFLNADAGEGFNVALDRISIGRLDGYDGGPIRLSLAFDTTGISVEAEAANGLEYESGRRLWSEVPSGFSPEILGDWAYLSVQNSDHDAGTPATVKVAGLSVRAANDLWKTSTILVLLALGVLFAVGVGLALARRSSRKA